MLTVNWDGIPPYLRDLDQWLLWRHLKGTKIPYSAKTGRAAGSTNRADWSTFALAKEVYEREKKKYAGVGLAFAPEQGITGIDLDDCLKDGALKPWAARIVNSFRTYTEISPSGNGLKLWVRGVLPGTGIKRLVDKEEHITADPAQADGAVEMYDRGRYFTVTGHVFGAVPVVLPDAQPILTKLYTSLVAAAAAADAEHATNGGAAGGPIKAGARHEYLVRHAAVLRKEGLDGAAILIALRAINTARCVPQKTDAELAAIVKWVGEKEPGELPKLAHEERASGSAIPPVTLNGFHLPHATGDKLPPNDIATLIMRDHHVLTDTSGLVSEYSDNYWRHINEGHIATYALEYDTHQYTNNKRRREAISFVLDAVRTREIPWRQLSDLEIPCANGILNVETCEMRPHKKDDYLDALIPIAYDPKARANLWFSAVERWFHLDGDTDAEAKVEVLQEFFGYCLLPHARFKRALFLYGESDTGKSQVPLVLRRMLGARNCCTLNTDQMADERKRSVIVGKALNIMTELPYDAMIADGGFKQLVSTGDPISIDPKYREPFSYIPFCKHLICANSLPTISDATSATYNRLLLLKFNHVIPANEQDDMLLEKLTEELAGILAWSVEGAHRLIQRRGKFTAIKESETAIAEYRAEQNPISDFITEKCDVPAPGDDPREFLIPSTEFWERFTRWNSGKPIDRNRMGRLVRSAGYRIESTYYGISKRTVRCIVGLRWQSTFAP
jgi:P4 family phage/plasmid primase-like protien